MGNVEKAFFTPIQSVLIFLCLFSLVVSGCSNQFMEDILKKTNPDPVALSYGIALSAPDAKDFGSVLEGYPEQKAYEVTITNTGNQPTGELTVTLTGTNDTSSDSFILSTAVIHSINNGNSDSFTVVPVTGLTKKLYTADVTVSGAKDISASFKIGFSVDLESIKAANICVTQPETQEYPDIIATAITAAGSGAVPASTPLSISSDEGNTGYHFDVGPVVWSCDGNLWSPDSRFRGSKIYSASVTLTAHEGYTFSHREDEAIIVAEINGEAVEASGTDGLNITLSYTFPKTAPAEITSVDLTISAPVKEVTPDIDPTCTAFIRTGNGDVAVSSVVWSCDDSDYDIPWNPASPFWGKTVYTVTVSLKASEGFIFTGDTEDTKRTAVTINGAAVTLDPAYAGGETLTLSYTFPETKPVIITSADVTVAAPATGYAPITLATGNGDFTTSEVAWDPWDPIDSPIIQAGIEYTATVKLTADIRFTFTSLTAATINGKSATIISNDDDGIIDGSELTLSYKFPATQNAVGISSASDLLSIVGSGRPLDGNYYLADNITLPEPEVNNWKRIGTNTSPFTGSFDGKGKTITFLSIDESTTDYQGMFGAIGPGGVVKNVTLVGCVITGQSNTGGIAGLNNGIVENCALIDCSITGTKMYTGGIVGANYSNVQNCYTTCTGSVSGLVSGSGEAAGGVVGYNSKSGIVQNCYSTSRISGADKRAGGIVGQNDSGTVQNCVALNKNISATNTSNFGRVVGQNNGGNLYNNYGQSDMPKEGISYTSWTNSITGADGASITTANYNNPDWWETPGNWKTTQQAFAWDVTSVTSVWAWNDSANLPKLQSEP